MGFQSRYICISILALMTSFMSLAQGGRHALIPEVDSPSVEYKIMADFMSRYISMLDRPSTANNSDSLKMISEAGFRYEVGNKSVLRNLRPEEVTSFNSEYKDGRYTVSWSKNGVIAVRCHFPANVGLLKFMNKIELDRQLVEKFHHPAIYSSGKELPRMAADDLKKLPNSDFYVHDKGYYLLPRLGNRVVYRQMKDGDGCELLIDDERYVLESIVNIMLTGYCPTNSVVTLNTSLYGYEKDRTEISLPNLYDVFLSEGATPYCGVETYDGQTVMGSWIWRNDYMGYSHVLYFITVR